MFLRESAWPPRNLQTRKHDLFASIVIQFGIIIEEYALEVRTILFVPHAGMRKPLYAWPLETTVLQVTVFSPSNSHQFFWVT